MRDSHALDGIPDADLTTLLNSWPEQTVGFNNDVELITILNQLCKRHGYGRVHQLMEGIEDLWRHPEKEPEYQAAHAERMELIKGTIEYYNLPEEERNG